MGTLSIIIICVLWASTHSLAQARQEMLVGCFYPFSLITTDTGSTRHTVVADAILRPQGSRLCSAVQTLLNINSRLSHPCFLCPLSRRGYFQLLSMLICFSLTPGFPKESLGENDERRVCSSRCRSLQFARPQREPGGAMWG